MEMDCNLKSNYKAKLFKLFLRVFKLSIFYGFGPTGKVPENEVHLSRRTSFLVGPVHWTLLPDLSMTVISMSTTRTIRFVQFLKEKFLLFQSAATSRIVS